jgi:hypothetical protein
MLILLLRYIWSLILLVGVGESAWLVTPYNLTILVLLKNILLHLVISLLTEHTGVAVPLLLIVCRMLAPLIWSLVIVSHVLPERRLLLNTQLADATIVVTLIIRVNLSLIT